MRLEPRIASPAQTILYPVAAFAATFAFAALLVLMAGVPPLGVFTPGPFRCWPFSKVTSTRGAQRLQGWARCWDRR